MLRAEKGQAIPGRRGKKYKGGEILGHHPKLVRRGWSCAKKCGVLPCRQRVLNFQQAMIAQYKDQCSRHRGQAPQQA